MQFGEADQFQLPRSALRSGEYSHGVAPRPTRTTDWGNAGVAARDYAERDPERAITVNEDNLLLTAKQDARRMYESQRMFESQTDPPRPRLRSALIVAVQTLLLVALGAAVGWAAFRLQDQQDYRRAILQASVLWSVPFLLCLLLLIWHLPRMLIPKPSHVIATFLGTAVLVVAGLQCRPYVQDYLGTPGFTQGIVTDRRHLPPVWDSQRYDIKVNGIWFEQGMSAARYDLAQPATCLAITYGIHSLDVIDLNVC